MADYDEPYTEVLDTGETRMVIVHGESQGVWAKVTINGKPATRYELHRGAYEFTTDDLTIQIGYSTAN